ncbi:hypothetical protein Tco_0245680 [Tanacetum coccineum]
MISTNPASAKAAWDTIETIFQENKRTCTVALKVPQVASANPNHGFKDQPPTYRDRDARNENKPEICRNLGREDPAKSHGTWILDFGTLSNSLRGDSTGDFIKSRLVVPQAFCLRALCHACQLGKHVRLPFSLSETIVKAPFDIIHSDLWTSPITSVSGIKYYVYKTVLLQMVAINLQRIDVDETFSPVVKRLATISDSTQLPFLGNWPVNQLVKNAFLHGSLS